MIYHYTWKDFHKLDKHRLTKTYETIGQKEIRESCFRVKNKNTYIHIHVHICKDGLDTV